MKIKMIETVVLSNAEYNLLNKANELLESIYRKAGDTEICELADKTTTLISELFEYIEREGD